MTPSHGRGKPGRIWPSDYLTVTYFRGNERLICVVQLLFVNQLTYFSCNFSGISGKVKIDDQSQTKWQIYPLEFKQDFISR